jgi:hypothetical protein
MTSNAMIAKGEALLPVHRERLYPPIETLSLLHRLRKLIIHAGNSSTYAAL